LIQLLKPTHLAPEFLALFVICQSFSFALKPTLWSIICKDTVTQAPPYHQRVDYPCGHPEVANSLIATRELVIVTNLGIPCGLVNYYGLVITYHPAIVLDLTTLSKSSYYP
jgi:hypothetical protein